jgi:hypothetical protein
MKERRINSPPRLAMKAVMSKVLLKATMSPTCALMCTYYYLYYYYYEEEVLLRGDSIVCGVWCEPGKEE